MRHPGVRWATARWTQEWLCSCLDHPLMSGRGRLKVTPWGPPKKQTVTKGVLWISVPEKTFQAFFSGQKMCHVHCLRMFTAISSTNTNYFRHNENLRGKPRNSETVSDKNKSCVLEGVGETRAVLRKFHDFWNLQMVTLGTKPIHAGNTSWGLKFAQTHVGLVFALARIQENI